MLSVKSIQNREKERRNESQDRKRQRKKQTDKQIKLGYIEEPRIRGLTDEEMKDKMKLSRNNNYCCCTMHIIIGF